MVADGQNVRVTVDAVDRPRLELRTPPTALAAPSRRTTPAQPNPCPSSLKVETIIYRPVLDLINRLPWFGR